MWIKENALSLAFSFIIFVVVLFIYLSSKKVREKNFDKTLTYFLVALVSMCVGLGTMILFLWLESKKKDKNLLFFRCLKTSFSFSSEPLLVISPIMDMSASISATLVIEPIVERCFLTSSFINDIIFHKIYIKRGYANG